MRVDGVNVQDDAGLGWDDDLATIECEGLRACAGGFGDSYKRVPEAEGFKLGT